MSQNTQARELRLAKIKSWYIPADTNSYQLLRGLKIPLLRVHKDFIPTLFLATKKAGIKPVSVRFPDILNAYLDKLGTTWQSKPGRTCRLNESRLTFSAPLTKRNREAIANLDISLAKFFERWAHQYSPVFSMSDDRLKLVVDYKFDADREPVIRAVEEVKPREHVLDLGFTRIQITFHEEGSTRRKAQPPMIQTEIFVKGGTKWMLTHTSTCLASEIGDLTQFIHALGILHAKREAEDK